MRVLMMDRPLLISSILEYGARYHGAVEIVSRSVEGPIHRTTYRAASGRAQQLAHALRALGARPGDRIATLAWNGHRHFELYYAISGMGAVCHTVNPRLFRAQIVQIMNHAKDRFIFADLTFVELVEELWDELDSVEGVVIMTDRAHMPETLLGITARPRGAASRRCARPRPRRARGRRPSPAGRRRSADPRPR